MVHLAEHWTLEKQIFTLRTHLMLFVQAQERVWAVHLTYFRHARFFPLAMPRTSGKYRCCRPLHWKGPNVGKMKPSCHLPFHIQRPKSLKFNGFTEKYICLRVLHFHTPYNFLVVFPCCPYLRQI